MRAIRYIWRIEAAQYQPMRWPLHHRARTGRNNRNAAHRSATTNNKASTTSIFEAKKAENVVRGA